MRNQRILAHLFLGWLLCLAACVETFEPKVVANTNPLLVVDGFINTKGATTIKLSRTTSLSEKVPPPPEQRALVRIEEENGSQIPLAEMQPGVYTSPATVLNTSKKYRLYLKTTDGKEYTSDFIEVKTTPPIDNVYWETANDGLTIYADAQDTRQATQYYRWEYEETWEFTSAFRSDIEYKDNRIQSRYDNIYNCWRTVNSTVINTFATTNLRDDIVRKKAIQSIPAFSSRLLYKYSILVKQYAQTKVEFDYWNLLKKNTENVGDIFGSLPVQLTGNIRAVSDASMPVIGFIGAYSEERKRIFIDRVNLPEEWRPVGELTALCGVPDTIPANNISIFNNSNILPIGPLFTNGFLSGYTISSALCVDCRKTGTNVRPSFWQ